MENLRAQYYTAQQLSELGEDRIPSLYSVTSHLVYSSPATLAYNSPGAEGFGVTAYRVTEKEEFEKVFQKALDDRKPAFIEVVIDDDDKVFPMCSPGAALKDTFDETDLRLKEGR